MDTVMTFLLIRFAVIVGVAVVLALLGFALIVWLRRSGRLPDAKRRATPLVRTAERMADRSRGDGASSTRGRGWVARSALEAARRHLEDDEPSDDGSSRDNRSGGER